MEFLSKFAEGVYLDQVLGGQKFGQMFSLRLITAMTYDSLILFLSRQSVPTSTYWEHYIWPNTRWSQCGGNFLFFQWDHLFFFLMWYTSNYFYFFFFLESAMDLHLFCILKPPHTSLPIPSLWVILVHQPWALDSCINACWSTWTYKLLWI